MTRARKLLLALAFAVVVPVGVAWAYWSVTSTPGGNGASAAASVNQGSTPTSSATGNAVTVTWSATTLSTGQAVDGYTITRYDLATHTAQTTLSGCTGTVAATTCTETGVPAGNWVYSVTPVIGVNWRGAVSASSSSTTVDTTPPVNAITLAVTSGSAGKVGNTVYYRGAAAGAFTLTNAVSDAGSGPASSTTAALGGTSTGWTHVPSTVSTPAGGPYASASFGWVAATTSAPTELVTGRDVTGNTATTTLAFVDDSTAPTGGTITYAAGYQAGQSVSVSFTGSTDGSGSGVLSYRLQRAQAPLSAGACPAAGSFSAFYDIGSLNPSSPYNDTQVTTSTCYLYQLVVTDRAGNQQLVTNANIAILGYQGAVSSTSGLLSYWRLGEPTTSLTATDAFTGTAASALTSHTADIGGTWANLTGSANTEKISTGGRAYREGTGYSINYLPATNPTTDYSVEADLFTKTLLTGEKVGVIARLSTTLTQTYYLASWEAVDHSWNLYRVVNGVPALLAYVPTQPAMVANGTKRLKLTVTGDGTTTTLSLFVNGVPAVGPVTDTTVGLQTAGQAGFVDGDYLNGAAVTKSDTTGLHLENFQVTPSTYPRAADSKGTNTGDYKNGVVLGVAGALTGDANTAAQFDGVNDHVQVTGSTGLPVGASARSVEMWFKTSSAARQVLFEYGSYGATQRFGLWIEPGGTALYAWGWGNGNDFTFPLATAVNNGAWHHVVKTYDGTFLRLYVDGVMLPAQAATRNTVIDEFGFSIGAALNSVDGNYGGFFTGAIDEVSFYNTTLTQAVVTQHYQMGAAVQTGPTGGSVDAGGLVGTGSRYSTSTTLNVVLAKGTDPDGVAASGAQLQRSTATLAAGTCGTFGGYTQVSTDPTSPRTDLVTDQACYRYQYLVPDSLGYYSTYTSPDIKVDTTAPSAPTLAFSAFTNTYWSGSGTTVYYRSAATSGSFTATGTATDPASGIASYTFPALGTNWTSTPGALGVNAYSWSGAPAAPGTKNVTATNNAGGVSTNSAFTMTADDIAPAAGTVTYSGGTTTSTSVSVSFTSGSDALTGIGTRLLQRAAAPLTGVTCGTFGVFATVTNGTNPTSPLTDTITLGSCYKYQYVVADGVGNQATFTNANTLKAFATYSQTVLATSGLVNYWRLGEALATSPMTDSGGTNHGTYFGSPTMALAGALAGDSNTAVQYNGTSQYSTAARQIQDDFSIEFWFKSTQVAGVNCTQWWEGMRLVDAEVGGANSDFGVSLCAGKIIGGVGNTSDVSIVTPGTYNNGAWHHVVFTRTKTVAAMQLYVDGAFVIAGTPNNTGSLTASSILSFGRGQSGSNYYSGVLDEVAVYGSVLSAATINGHYQNGATAADTTGPTGGSVDATGLVGTGSRYATSTTLSLALAKGTDTNGVATTGNTLLRATATLTGGTCGTFGGYSPVTGGTDPTTPKTDSVTDQACFSYQYVVLDTLGNATTYTSPDIKVDLTAPSAPTMAFSAFTNSSWNGATLYYRSGSGSFTTTATATDAVSGIASYTFPVLGTGWTSTLGALGVRTNTWTGTPAAPGTVSITATNNAGGTSAAGTFPLLADDVAPTGGSVTYTDGAGAATVTFTTGTDSASGIGTRLLQRASATASGGVCGTFGAFSTIATNPTSPYSDATATTGNCYQYQYAVSDAVGNQHTITSTNILKFTLYLEAVNTTAGLTDYWRLAESATALVSSDSFTGTAATPIASHAGETGATWVHQGGTSTTEQISSENRLRREGGGYSIDYASGTPSSADYSVEADLYARGTLAADSVGVLGRLDTATSSFYMARWEIDKTWKIVKWSNNLPGTLATTAVLPDLVVGSTSRVRLQMSGTTLKLSVNGVQLLSVTDAVFPFTIVGKAGIMDGDGVLGTALKTDVAGLHFEDFQVTPATYPRAANSKSGNTGDYVNGVTMGVAGAIVGDGNTAAQFDGVNDHVQVTGSTGIPAGSAARSAEMWFKTSSAARQVLFSYGSPANTQEFGLWLNAGGASMTAWGSGADKVFTLAAAVNNGAWHQVVKTYDGTTIALYVDGVALTPQAATRATVMDTYGFGIGAIIATGNANSGGYFAGSLDEVSVYSTVLSQATVSSHYALGTGSTGFGLTPGSTVVLNATTAGYTDRYIHHTGSTVDNAVINAGSSSTEKGNASWIVRAGLSNSSCVSFESSNTAGQYLRHSNFQISLILNDNSTQFAQDATFCPETGRNGQGVSLKAINYSGRYIRHYSNSIYIADTSSAHVFDAAGSFNNDTSWLVSTPWP
jgi:alpha-L-arabinofuranosidase B-like protein/concanavalin A-like lectin/glucanase superfamily protein